MMFDRPRIGVVTEPLVGEPLIDVMNWLLKDVPEVTDLEIGTGAYAPTGHCDMPLMLRDAGVRARWFAEIKTRGLRLAALNCWGNPLHPDAAVAAKHDSDLRDSIRLAAELGVDRSSAWPAARQAFRARRRRIGRPGAISPISRISMSASGPMWSAPIGPRSRISLSGPIPTS